MRLRPALLLTLFLSPILPFTVLTTLRRSRQGRSGGSVFCHAYPRRFT